MSYPATVRAVEARAVAAIVIASLTIALHDALVKRINDELGIWQLYLLRALFALPLLTALMRMRGVSLRPRRAGWVALRSLLMVTMWGFFYAALAQLSLPVVAATAYTFPLLLALMAAWLPDEHLDAGRHGADHRGRDLGDTCPERGTARVKTRAPRATRAAIVYCAAASPLRPSCMVCALWRIMPT